MKRKIASVAILLFVLLAVKTHEFGQESKPPLTKDEMLRLLKAESRGRLGQTNIVIEVAERGIAFPVDEPTLEELRRAGARSLLLEEIRRAGKNPRAGENDATSEESRQQGRTQDLEQLPLLEQARHHALDFVEELPNFTVTQVVRRYARPRGNQKWELQDTLEVELSYSGDKGEKFKMLSVNGARTRMTYEQLGGSTSTGEFGSMLVGLFAPQSQADFKEIKNELFREHKTVVFDFRVRTPNSRSQITDKASGREIISGYQGSVWIDTESKRVLRLELSHDDIPSGFPVTVSENAVEYDWVTVAAKRYLMPVRAEMLLGGERGRYYTRNVIEMRNYHKFEADVKILTSGDSSQ